MTRKIAVIDLGFNSLKLVNYVVGADGKEDSYTAYEQWSLRTKLGEGMARSGLLLGERQIRRTLDDLKLLGDLIGFHSIDHVLPVATSAVREASNRNQFLRQVRAETGFAFRVLSGEEEALYSFVGAVRALALPDVLFFDLGGGSLELVSAENFQIKKTESLPLGALRLSQAYSDRGDGSFSRSDYDRMRNQVMETLPDREELGLEEADSKGAVLLGVGGALRTLARYDQEIQQYPLNKIHNYSMSRGAVESARRTLVELSPAGLAEIDAIGGDRADTIVAGCCVIESLMEKWDFSRLVVSTHGLRDGILLEYLAGAAPPREGVDVSRIENLVAPGRSPRFRFENTEALVDTFVARDLLDERERVILADAMRENLAKSQQWRPEPLFHIVMDEDSALNHRDQLLAALSLVRAKRPRAADSLYPRYKALLKPGGKDAIKKLSSLVELLEILERTGSRVRVIEGRGDGGKINMQVIAEHEAFPSELFRSAVKEVEKVFDLSLEYSIRPQEAVKPRA